MQQAFSPSYLRITQSSNENRAYRPISIKSGEGIQRLCAQILCKAIMLEILQDFEQAAARFAPLVLIVPGLAAVVIGLFVWLGGLGFRKLLLGAAGATAGGACGFFLIGRNLAAAAILAGLAALVAIIFERLFLVVLAVILATIVSFAVLARPHLQSANAASPSHPAGTLPQGQTATVRQSIETTKAYAVNLGQAIKRTCSEMPAYSWAILAAAVVLSVVAGLCLRRLVWALCCAVLGTSLIFAGLILLMLYKGAAPITRIAMRSPFYAAVFAGMAAFGTVEQLLLCCRREKRSAKGKKADKDEEEPEHRGIGWRGK
jgi:hypothetical protein